MTIRAWREMLMAFWTKSLSGPDPDVFWFLGEEDETYFMKKWARHAWRRNVDLDRHNLFEMEDMQAINEDILMRSQGFEGSFQDFLQSRGMSAEEFKPIFDVWDQEYLEAMDEEAPIIPAGGDLEMVELKGGIDEPYKWREDMSYSELDDLAEDIFNILFFSFLDFKTLMNFNDTDKTEFRLLLIT